MNSEGIAIAGDPPPPPGSEKSTNEDAIQNDPGLLVDLWISKITRVLKLIAKVAIGSVAAVVLYLMYDNFKPNTLAGRGSEVSEAILNDDLPKFNTFAYGDTGIDLFEWYGFMRPNLDELRKRVSEKEMGYKVTVKSEDSADHSAEITLRLGAKNELSRREITTDEELTGQLKQYMDLRTFWKVDNFGRWWLDGSQTLRGPTSAK